MRKVKLDWISLSVIPLVLLALNACGDVDKSHEPTGKAAFVPGDRVEYPAYLEKSQKNIQDVFNQIQINQDKKAWLGGYDNAQVAQMRSPYQRRDDRCVDANNGGKKGFLLIHGLTDSPYLMNSISDSLHAEYPCALIRAILLPGHGTVPGDSLHMQKADWRKMVAYGVDSFKKEEQIQDLYLVGFSTGTSLAIDYMRRNRGDNAGDWNGHIKGLILFSTAVKAKKRFAFLTPWVSHLVDWYTLFNERDAARYESFSFNAGGQFYHLTQGMADPEYALEVPVFMVLSADDDTIDARAAREFYCYAAEVKRRALVWYQSIDEDVNSAISTQNTPELMCDNIIEVKLSEFDPKYKTLNLSHASVLIAPEDTHYGVNGHYHDCRAYDTKNTQKEFFKCQDDTFDHVYGENMKLLEKLGQLNGRYFRKGTFNPDYENLKNRILCFINDTCSIETLIKH